MTEKTRYSDEELEEFKAIIDEKLRLAKRDYEEMMDTLMNKNGNDVDDTSPTYKVLEEGSATQSKEELIQLAGRQQKFIQGLEAALIRIKNKTMRKEKQTTVAIIEVVTELFKFLYSFAPNSLETNTEEPILQPTAKARKIRVIS